MDSLTSASEEMPKNILFSLTFFFGTIVVVSLQPNLEAMNITSLTPEKYTITYSFNHSRMGFNNQVTVEANCYDQAIEKAKNQVSMCYGSKMLKKFSFK